VLLDDLHKLMVFPQAVQVQLTLRFVFLAIFLNVCPQQALDGGIQLPHERGMAGLVIPDEPVLRPVL
jgi:hypothetical protein